MKHFFLVIQWSGNRWNLIYLRLGLSKIDPGNVTTQDL